VETRDHGFSTIIQSLKKITKKGEQKKNCKASLARGWPIKGAKR